MMQLAIFFLLILFVCSFIEHKSKTNNHCLLGEQPVTNFGGGGIVTAQSPRSLPTQVEEEFV